MGKRNRVFTWLDGVRTIQIVQSPNHAWREDYQPEDFSGPEAVTKALRSHWEKVGFSISHAKDEMNRELAGTVDER